jgi:P-type conjugative transfer protein TrbJ
MRRCLVVALVALLAMPQRSDAIWAMESTQWVNRVTLLAQKAQQAEMILIMLRNSQRFPNLPWTRVISNVQRVRSNLVRGLSIYTLARRTGRQFRRTFPGLRNGQLPFAEQYAQWNEVTMDTVEGIVDAMSEETPQIDDAMLVIEELRSQAAAAEGQLEAQQSIAAINAEAVNHLISLRELLSREQAMNATHIAAQLQKEATAEGAAQQFFGFVPQNDTGNRSFTMR